MAFTKSQIIDAIAEKTSVDKKGCVAQFGGELVMKAA
jgi:hypothetical protein